MARVLVVGGAGYVGSATCAYLVDQGHEVTVLDNLSTGHHSLVFGDLAKNFILGHAGDADRLSKLLEEKVSNHALFDCVMHFAARSLVSESIQRPAEYFENNVDQTNRLLETLLRFNIRNFIFSSTCAIFGDPGAVPIHEDLPKSPLNPYGQTKLEVEKKLESLAITSGLRSISLRYFNAAGAEPHLRTGEWHEPETHLIPKILKAVMQGVPVQIFGQDYPTSDGTCIRDYVHVWDLAQAHCAAMDRLLEMGLHRNGALHGSFEAYNLGSEKGFSVREVIGACEEVIGVKIKTIETNRRPGDPSRLVADSTLAKKILGFGKNEQKLKSIIYSALNWENKRNKMTRPAVFLDRDGTLNEDPGYLSDPNQMKLLPQVGEALAELKKAGYILCVISNQSGVGRGLISKENIPKIHQRLDDLLSPWVAKIDHYELCFHHPDEQCDCRKPKPKLILDSARQLNLDLSRSYMIGDKKSDIEAGQAAGCKGSILVKTGYGAETAPQLESREVSFIADSLLQAARWILSQ